MPKNTNLKKVLVIGSGPIVIGQAAEFDLVAQNVFSTSGAGMQRMWFQMVFSGRVNAPKYLNSSDEILNYIREHPGTVGIVVSEQAPAGVTGFRLEGP